MKKFVVFLVLFMGSSLVLCQKTNDIYPREEIHSGIFCIREDVLLGLAKLLQAREFREAKNVLASSIQAEECAVTEKEGYAFLLNAFTVELSGFRQVEVEVFRVRLSAPPFVLFFENGQVRLLVFLEEIFLIKGAETLIKEMEIRPAALAGN